jgi:hypothetical protein
MAMKGRNLMGGRNPGRAKAIQQALREALSGGATGDMASGMRSTKLPNMMGEAGKTMSDADRQRAMDRAAMLEAMESGNPMRAPRSSPLAPKTSPRPRMRPDTVDVSPNAERGDIQLMLQEMLTRGGGMNLNKGGAVKKRRLANKPRKGCVMSGRGGKFKGVK